MKKIYLYLNRISVIASTICLFLLIVYVSLLSTAFNKPMYIDFSLNNNTAEKYGVDQATYEEIVIKMIDYLDSKEADMQYCIIYKDSSNTVLRRSSLEECPTDPSKYAVYRTEEIEHMVDVKVLFENGKKIALGCLIILIICISYLIVFHKQLKYRDVLYFRNTMLGIFGVLAILAIIAAFDFSSVFTVFHQIFFTNSKWMLNSYDALIVMLPIEFFMQIVAITIFKLISLLMLYFILVNLLKDYIVLGEKINSIEPIY